MIGCLLREDRTAWIGWKKLLEEDLILT